ncbi:MAG: hypothetical protein IPK12_14845 [Gemmatimonadetes bacterium]|nr:hypothetical protein [Gemmatimonadota bacterium]
MRRTLLLLALAGLAACQPVDDRPKARLADTFSDVPLPPGAQGLGRQDAADAVQLMFKTPLAPAAVADYYRASLQKKPWSLKSESTLPNGSLTFYAEQDSGPPLWVSIRMDSTLGGSYVDLTGAKTK